MSMNRRVLLKGTLATGALSVAMGAGLIHPRSVLAAWPKDAFAARSQADVMASLYGAGGAAESGDIKIKAPDIAENGSVVPVTVSTTLSGVESITILVDSNNSPMAGSFNVASAEPYVSTRIKMGKTGNVIAVAKADGKLMAAQKEVKVTIGGCGG